MILSTGKTPERSVADEGECAFVYEIFDGVATGTTIQACLQRILDDPASLVVAVPVGPPHTLDEFTERTDGAVPIRAPEALHAVGRTTGTSTR